MNEEMWNLNEARDRFYAAAGGRDLVVEFMLPVAGYATILDIARFHMRFSSDDKIALAILGKLIDDGVNEIETHVKRFCSEEE
jgi:hypothetical protein